MNAFVPGFGGPLILTDQRPYSHGKEEIPMRKSPWHSIKQNVHHDNPRCTEGNNIETENLRQGTGGKPLCHHCAKFDTARE